MHFGRQLIKCYVCLTNHRNGPLCHFHVGGDDDQIRIKTCSKQNPFVCKNHAGSESLIWTDLIHTVINQADLWFRCAWRELKKGKRSNDNESTDHTAECFSFLT